MTRIGEHKLVSTRTSRSKSLSWYYKNTSDTLVSTRSDRLVSTRSDTLVSSRWSSSERPLFVRTVWSGGIRHAILSLDDPLSGQTASGTIRHHQTSDNFRHLQTQSGIIRHHQTLSSRHHQTSAFNRNLSSAYTTASEDMETLSTSSGTHEEDPKSGCDSWEEANFHQQRRRNKQKVKKKKKYGCSHPIDNNPESDDLKKVTTFDDSTFPETRFMLGEESRNALSERVLQWLDLANKAAKSGGNSSGKSRILAKRINTAMPGAYYLEPPNYQPPGNHLKKKITKQCMEDYAAPTETGMDLHRSSISSSSPRRFSLQGSTHPPSIDHQRSSPRRSSLQATKASSHPNCIRKGFDAYSVEMSRINPQRCTASAHPLRKSFDQSSVEFFRHQSNSSITPSYPEETDVAAKTTQHRTSEPRPATVHNKCYLNCTETDDTPKTSHHRTIAPRVGNAWTRTMSEMPSRPQLHIFMPHLPPHARVASFDGSDCLSNSGCEQAVADG